VTLAGTVVVTGAAQGIGAAIAQACSDAGAAVGLLDIADCSRTAAAIAGPHHVVPIDLRDAAAIPGAIAECAGELGPISGLVNNAAVLHEASIVATTEEQWAETIEVNLTAAWRLTAAVVPQMLDQGGGAIVNIASIEAHNVRADHAPYVAAKAGLIALTKATAIEYGRQGIRANSISPGSIATEMFENYVQRVDDPEAFRSHLIGMNYRGRLGTPEEIAAATVFLLSDASGFTNGTDLVIDGGRISAT
jgi:NAD(P)-dependent dehydrogenase (short-subunit alcohol dehydrogenase family)